MMRLPKVAILTLALSLPIIITFEIIDVTVKEIWIEHPPESVWCEGLDLDPHLFIRERFNARSDYAYIVLGCWMVALGVNDAWNNYRKKVNANNHEMIVVERGGDSNKEVSFPLSLGGEMSNTDHNSSNSIPPGQKQEETGASSLFQDNISIEQPAALEEPPLPIQSNKISNGLFEYPYITIINGIINILHGLGSFWNHACQCPGGGTADTAGMMGVIVFPIFYSPLQLLMGYTNSCTSLPLSYSKKKLILKAASFITIFGQITIYILALWNAKLRKTKNFEIIVYVSFAWFPLLFIYMKYWRNKRLSNGDIKHELKYNIMILGFGSFLLGYLCWKLDVDKIWCFDKESQFHFFQGHAFWHILTCGTLAFIYLFYRTEELIYLFSNDMRRGEESGGGEVISDSDNLDNVEEDEIEEQKIVHL
jgi:hypothetical protein